jgi:adenosine deaminase CECR1
MVGAESMSLLGWKQLAQWSLEHSCMEPEERALITSDWERRWNEYCQWIVNNYSHLDDYKPERRH